MVRSSVKEEREEMRLVVMGGGGFPGNIALSSTQHAFFGNMTQCKSLSQNTSVFTTTLVYTGYTDEVALYVPYSTPSLGGAAQIHSAVW